MEENEILAKFRRHTGKSVKFKVKNEQGDEDEFELLPMNVEEFAQFIVIAEELNKDTSKSMAKELITLYKDLIKRSYPNLPEDVVDGFLINNFESIMDTLQKLVPVEGNANKRQDLMKKIKQMQKGSKTEEPQEMAKCEKCGGTNVHYKDGCLDCLKKREQEDDQSGKTPEATTSG